MAETRYPECAEVDAEYAAAHEAYHAARRWLKEVGARRSEAHVAAEYARSREAQRLLQMSDVEWEAHKQRIENARGPKIEPVVNAPGA